MNARNLDSCYVGKLLGVRVLKGFFDFPSSEENSVDTINKKQNRKGVMCACVYVCVWKYKYVCMCKHMQALAMGLCLKKLINYSFYLIDD